MQNRSAARRIATPRPPQSIAALLPAEIVDCIFFHFDFNYSIDAAHQDAREGDRVLSKMSVVAEGWKGPARRLLFRKMRIRSWKHLQKTVKDWAGGEVMSLDLDTQRWPKDLQAAASAVFALLKKVPNYDSSVFAPFHSLPSILPNRRPCRLLYSFPISSISPSATSDLQSHSLNPSSPTFSRHPVIKSPESKSLATT